MPYGKRRPLSKSAKASGPEAELGHVELEVALVEQAEDHLFAEERREGGDPVVHFPPGHLDLDAPVLGQPPLGDVELRHDLDAGGDSGLEPQRGLHDVVEDPVDAVADPEGFLVGLDVDVRRRLLDRVGQDQVHQLDDRGVLGGLAELRGVDGVLVVLQRLDVLVVERLHDVFDHAGRIVVLVDRVPDGGLRRDDGLDLEPGHELDVVDGEDVARVGHGDGEDVACAIDGDDLVFLRDLGRDELNDDPVDLEVGQVDGGDAVLAAQERRDVVFADEPQLHQVGADAAARRLLLLQGLVELFAGDEGRLDEHVAKAHGAGCHGSPLGCVHRAVRNATSC
jgi:hypothetical protein